MILSRVAAVFVIGTYRVASLEPPPSGPCSAYPPLPPSLPPSFPALLRSFGIQSGMSAALQFHSCLLWRRHTRRDEFRILHAPLSARVMCVYARARVRSQHMLSSVSTERRVEPRDAVRAG